MKYKQLIEYRKVAKKYYSTENIMDVVIYEDIDQFVNRVTDIINNLDGEFVSVQYITDSKLVDVEIFAIIVYKEEDKNEIKESEEVSKETRD